MDTLRKLLEKMTRDGSPVETYPGKLTAISIQHPHTIRVLPSPHGEDLGRFNCVMYALGLVAALEPPCNFVGRFYADTGYFDSLIQQRGLSPCAEKKGALVVWTSAGATKHVGIMRDQGRAASKWGIGYVCEHGPR